MTGAREDPLPFWCRISLLLVEFREGVGHLVRPKRAAGVVGEVLSGEIDNFHSRKVA